MSEWSHVDEEMTLDKLKEYLKWKFPDRERAPDYDYVTLFEALQEYSPRNFHKLDSIINKNIGWIREAEECLSESLRRLSKYFFDTGIIAWMLCEKALKVHRPHKSRYIE